MPDSPILEPTSDLSPNLRPLAPAEVIVVHPLREAYWLHACFAGDYFTTLTVGAGMQFIFRHNFCATR